MRIFQCVLLCSFLHLVSVNAFGSCENAEDQGACPDNAACVSLDGFFQCQCEEGFDEMDLPDITREGQAATVCIDLGYCSPFDNNEVDCQNGCDLQRSVWIISNNLQVQKRILRRKM